MRKSLSLVLALAMVFTMFVGLSTAYADTTQVGTPRNETLVMECQSPTDNPGIFNPYMIGSSMGFGVHQLMMSVLWEMDTAAGEQFGEIADGMPEPNEDFTEFTVKLRQGIKWSDGVDLTADDIVYTFTMIQTTPSGISMTAYLNQILDHVEKIDDYTVKFIMNDPFPRLTQTFGVTIWGNSYRIVPEHIYSQVEDVTQFKDSNPVVAGPYTVKDYDPNGWWVLYELREDWMSSTLGVAGGAYYGYTEENAPAKYVWVRALGDDTNRQMAMINNEVDLLCEVTPEMLEYMRSQNDKIACWYSEFPYATSDDPCSKGLVFSNGQGEPWSNPYFHWGIALAMDFDEISLGIFDGAGRAAAFPVITATSSGQELYYKPLLDWLQNEFTIELPDGTVLTGADVWDPDYATRMAAYLGIEGDEDYLIDMFGVGCWKYNPEAAEKLFLAAGLEKKDDGWYFGGEKFSIELSYLADSEAQAGRGVQGAYDQLTKFGFDVTIVSKSQASWDTDGSTGNFQIAGYWPFNFITKDIYDKIQGFANDLIVPVGERAVGQSCRWDNAEATAIIKKLAGIDPNSEESYELGLEFLKIAIQDLPMIGFHSGVKFVPSNSSIWEGYPTADNPYNGPWWWWSCFKYILPNITLVK